MIFLYLFSFYVSPQFLNIRNQDPLKIGVVDQNHIDCFAIQALIAFR